MKVSAFDILKTMSTRDIDIRGFNVFDNLTYITQGKKNGKITLAIDNESAQRIMFKATGLGNGNPVIGMLIVADEAQYNALKKELEEASE